MILIQETEFLPVISGFHTDFWDFGLIEFLRRYFGRFRTKRHLKERKRLVN